MIRLCIINSGDRARGLHVPHARRTLARGPPPHQVSHRSMSRFPSYVTNALPDLPTDAAIFGHVVYRMWLVGATSISALSPHSPGAQCSHKGESLMVSLGSPECGVTLLRRPKPLPKWFVAGAIGESKTQTTHNPAPCLAARGSLYLALRRQVGRIHFGTPQPSPVLASYYPRRVSGLNLSRAVVCHGALAAHAHWSPGHDL